MKCYQLMRASWLSFALFSYRVLATWRIECSSPADAQKISDAVGEAKKMAANAISKLADLNDPVTKAAFTPLFAPEDVPTLLSLYGKVVNLDSDPMDVTFFCDTKSFITWHDPSQAWVDTRFTYEHQGVTKTIAQYKPAGPPNPNSNPGNQGSFTLNGYILKLLGGDADCSNQAHIYVSGKRVNPPAGDNLDHRSLDTVNKDGLLTDMTALDQLKPLSETIFHELMHALGGLSDPLKLKGQKVITDHPAGNAVTVKVREYNNCVTLNGKRGTLEAAGVLPTQRADPLMMLAKALYIQPGGKACYWSTGKVDKDKLTPIGLPSSSGSNPNPNPKAKGRRLIRWFG